MMKPYKLYEIKKHLPERNKEDEKKREEEQQEERTNIQPRNNTQNCKCTTRGHKRERERESNGMSCFGGSSFIHSFHF
jgi:hypothetical protein